MAPCEGYNIPRDMGYSPSASRDMGYGIWDIALAWQPCAPMSHKRLGATEFATCRRWVGADPSALQTAHITYCGRLQSGRPGAEDACKARLLAAWWNDEATSDAAPGAGAKNRSPRAAKLTSLAWNRQFGEC